MIEHPSWQRGRFYGLAVGLGTAMVYPTLLVPIADNAAPTWRGSAVGVYRLWRDSGYAAGALLAGMVADALGIDWAIMSIAALTLASGVLVAIVMRERRRGGDTGRFDAIERGEPVEPEMQERVAPS